MPLALEVTTASAFGLGMLAVFTSVMIYHDTRRSLWRFPLGAARFFGTIVSFAALGTLLSDPTPKDNLLFAIIVVLKMIPEARLLKLAYDPDA